MKASLSVLVVPVISTIFGWTEQKYFEIKATILSAFFLPTGENYLQRIPSPTSSKRFFAEGRKNMLEGKKRYVIS